ncbi:MAG: mechanosensitive ion channel family protein [Thermoproteota archaeon]|nr:mechanosensitive ion channel family protein [Candidatus Brockarchaeota archaeon]MBO3768712.1 mechanosensitive ion channel family protein [Candidatus Brockarchaeota archaeon]MBO3801716.1 mechanosensitive ion channel family protein [Candidatus Brockarchaeota archaeon]
MSSKTNKKFFWLLIAVTIILVTLFYYKQSIVELIPSLPISFQVDKNLIYQIILSSAIFYVVYLAISHFISSAITKSGGKPGDIKMLLGLWRSIVIFAYAITITNILFGGITFVAALGAFSGLFLGWSLQQPVTGLAAWFLITLRRPFRVGDRIFLPAWGIIGDVVDVGMMYTVLNQVGGTVGSEEPSGRYVLVPNAILFSNVIINYSGQAKTAQPYILDEVVVRITYDSDWDEAERILIKVAKEVTGDIINETKQEPYIRSDFYDYGVYLRLRYMTLAVDRPRIAHEINKRIFKEFQSNSKVDFAIPFVYSHKKGEKFFSKS